MEENNKVIVFEKKEIILILVFVLVLIVTSFTLGIRLGKKLNTQVVTAPVVTVVEEPSTTHEVELKSVLEEDVEKSIKADSQLSDEEKLKKLMDESKSRLNDELEKFTQDNPAPTTDTIKPAESPTSADSMFGKFTVQLGSYPSLEEAKQFAEGFTVRGYNPIINETIITGKGTWYRVSLGLFSSVEEAKTYIRNEQSLFSGQDYVITEIK